MADSMMTDDNGVQRRSYPKGEKDMSTKTLNSHVETDRISGGPTTPDNGSGYGPTGSDREYPKGKKVDMSADFLPKATDNYVGGVGPGVSED